MRNIKKFVRKAYWTALNNTITYKGSLVPCYDTFAPDNAVFPYILIGNQTQADDKDNQEYNYVTTIVLDVVTGAIAPYGRLDADNIADSILQLVCLYPENYLALEVGKMLLILGLGILAVRLKGCALYSGGNRKEFRQSLTPEFYLPCLQCRLGQSKDQQRQDILLSRQ